jgi:hypothetical protein
MREAVDVDVAQTTLALTLVAKVPLRIVHPTVSVVDAFCSMGFNTSALLGLSQKLAVSPVKGRSSILVALPVST